VPAPAATPRIGIVDYANVAPLVDGLEPRWALRRETPARLADLLGMGDLDVAILPTIELARMPGVRALPRLGIAADGRCDSVLLFSTVPLRDVRVVTLDAASRTSAALTRILLEREGSRDVRFVGMEGGSVAGRLAAADATLLIGDPALRAHCPEGVTRFDLAAEWKRHVGLPFVFACWAALDAGESRSHAAPGGLPVVSTRSPAGQRTLDFDAIRARLEEAAERGLARIPELAQEQARRMDLPVRTVEAYLRLLQYRLDDRHVRGMQAFLDEASRIAILDTPAEIAWWP
jgi:chorismate dehydratase